MEESRIHQLETEVEALGLRLEEAGEILRAIRNYEVDALVVKGPDGDQVFTLQGAEHPYRVLVETMSEGALTMASDATILFCNSRLAELIQVPLNRIIGASFHDYVISGNGQSLEAMLHACEKEGCRGEFFLKAADGTQVPVSLSARLLMLDDVGAFCIVVTDLTDQMRARKVLEKSRDHLEERVAERTAELSRVNAVLQEKIAERTQAEEALRESEAKFRSVLEHSRDIVYRMNMQTGRYEYISPSAEKVAGFSPGELLTQGLETALMMIHPNDMPAMRAALARLEETGQAEAEYRQRAKSGDYRWLSNHMSLTRDGDGRPLYRDGNIRDITERKHVETALRKSESSLSEAQRIGLIGSWEWNIRTGEVIWSGELYSIYGLDPATFVPTIHSFTDYVHPDDRESVNSIISQTVSGNTSVNFDFRIVLADGSIRVLNTVGEITDFDENGKPCLMVGINQDITERKRIEEELRESKTRLDLALHSASMGAWHWDLVEDRRYFDDQVCHLLGIEPATFTGTADEFFRAVHPDDRDMLKAALARTLEQDVLYEPEYRAIWPDGSVHHIAARGRLVRHDASNRPERISGILWDITERRQAEEKILRQTTLLEGINRIFHEVIASTSEEELGIVCLSVAEELTDSRIGFIGEIHQDGQLYDITISNPGWDACRIYEKTGHTAPIGAFKIHGLYGHVLADSRSLLTNDPPSHPASIGLPKGHPPLTAFLGVPLTDSGKTIGLVAVGNREGGYGPEHQQILETLAPAIVQALLRKRAESEVHKSRDELELRVQERTEDIRRQADLLELAHSAIFVRDLDSRITFWNARAQELYGWTKAEALGKVSYTLLKTQFPVPFEEHMKVLTKEGRWEGELLHTTKDGRQITVLSRHALQRDKDGNPAAILEINLDVTEARRTEQELRQAHKMEALGTLTGGIAHDFNNILAAIIGFTELSEERAPKGSPEEHRLRRVKEAGLRGRELVKQMLTFSRKTEIQKQPLQLSTIVTEAMKLLRASIPSTVSINFKIDSTSDLVLADPTQMQQVLLNLCTNAAHAMREKGGTLDIGLSDHSVSTADGMKPGPYLRLVVHDTGVGIPADIVDKIFDPFFTTKAQGEGTGLGLSVVHGIVKQHDGYITVESTPGKGSTFTVYLPKVAERPEARRVEDGPVQTGHERVLFVDDEEALVEMGEDILAELGYEVTSRMNGREALVLFRLDPSRFDLVITDQTMPEMTGIELAREILTIRADMPIIMCTGFSHLVDADRARAAGIRAFAMKPLTKREIARTIRQVLDG